MMSAATSKNDMDRWGMFPFRASPRQADVLIVAGVARGRDGTRRPAGRDGVLSCQRHVRTPLRHA